MLRRGIAAIATTCALTVAGCGSSDTLTRAEFIKQANAACDSVRKQFAHSNIHGLKEFREAIVASQTARTRKMMALQPPLELRVPYQQYVHVLQERTAMLAQAVEMTRRNRVLKVDAVKTAELQTSERQLVTKLKLTKC